MPIGLRRFLLNLSVIIIAFGAFLLYTRISYNNSLSIVEATVIREYVPEGSSYVDPLTGSTIYGEIHPAYSYVFNGETFDEYDPYHLPNDMSAHDIRSLKLGDKVNFYVNYKGDTKYREDYHMPIRLLITGVLMFVVGSKAIKGYFNDFIIRYKKTHIICLTYLVLYALFTYWCNVNSGGMFDFGGSLIIWLLGTGISIVFLAVVWIVSVVKYHSANK